MRKREKCLRRRPALRRDCAPALASDGQCHEQSQTHQDEPKTSYTLRYQRVPWRQGGPCYRALRRYHAATRPPRPERAAQRVDPGLHAQSGRSSIASRARNREEDARCKRPASECWPQRMNGLAVQLRNHTASPARSVTQPRQGKIDSSRIGWSPPCPRNSTRAALAGILVSIRDKARPARAAQPEHEEGRCICRRQRVGPGSLSVAKERTAPIMNRNCQAIGLNTIPARPAREIVAR